MKKQLKGMQLETLTSQDKTLLDIHSLANAGFNCVRIPIYLSYIQDLNIWINHLKHWLAACQNRNIRAFVCIHHPTRAIAGSEIFNAGQFCGDWLHLCQQLKDYEFTAIPVNEPKKLNNGVRIRDIYQQVALSINQTKPRRIAFAIPGIKASSIKSWKPIQGVKNQLTEVHLYDFIKQQVSPEGKYPTGDFSKLKLETIIRSVKAWGSDNNQNVIIGETAFNVDAIACRQYIADFMDLCNKHEVDYMLHAFKEAAVWDYQAKPKIWKAITSRL